MNQEHRGLNTKATIPDGKAGIGLDELPVGATAEVQSLSANLNGPARRRLLDLGILPGTRILVEMRSPSGDPTAYRIRNALIALRAEQAHDIRVREMKVDHD
jgi:Fe2+ transport system protein FeoA